MRQIEIFEVPSPCIGVCTNGPRGYCTGCFRSRDERLHWLNIDNNTRKQINDACSRRKASYLKRKQSQANTSQPTQVQESIPQQDSLF
ncbi:DUF1289 domain-containing protein [Alteromonas sp. LMIT006]|jgi:predicted Fe-S protein YdhL (DUF1289 family)|uniref:DUF1289 domain-containing protein n=1 Tax=Alteromonadaceae TaxID=72275 RepID=UPI0020CA2F0C|nr:DUF1289 domain-containing protein [Alteromonas sp. LMIT006]UTP73752.1 DUF1289 domain-containing protein [Alteromonas sp. LMIT006]